MIPTTIKLPSKLKARISRLAKKASQSPHAWMLEALQTETDRAESWNEFVAEAEQAADEIDAGAPVYAMEDVHQYLRDRVEGKTTSLKPVPHGSRKP